MMHHGTLDGGARSWAVHVDGARRRGYNNAIFGVRRFRKRLVQAVGLRASIPL
jgi:hypothetical protein